MSMGRGVVLTLSWVMSTFTIQPLALRGLVGSKIKLPML
jgi:hypothetical protein